MKTKILLASILIVLAGSVACWDHDDDWDDSHDHFYTLRVGVTDTCHDGPFSVYLDGTDSHDKVGEVRGSGGELTLVLEEGWYRLVVEDSYGHELYDEHFRLDDDETIRVHC